MSNKITSLSESPCWTCFVGDECSARRKKNRNLDSIVDMVWDKADYNRENCPLYIAITAPEMVEED